MTKRELAKLTEKYENLKPVQEWDAIPQAKELKKMNFGSLMENRTKLKDEIEFREKKLKDLNEEITAVLLAAEVEDGVKWEGRKVQVVSRAGSSKIVPEKLLENGVTPEQIAKSTVVGAGYQYLDVRKVKE